MRIAWPKHYYGVGNSFGYAQMADRARAALADAGAVIDPAAPVAIHATPGHLFEPLPGKINLAYVAWESEELPADYARYLAPAAALIVTARFLIEPFQRMFPYKPVFLCRLGVDSERFSYVDRDGPKLRPYKNRKRPFRFLWVGAPNARKGPLHVLEAWRAFSEGPGEKLLHSAELYIKTSSWRQRGSGVKRVGNAVLDDRRLPDADLVRLYHQAHAFVFPSMGEGFGFTAAEAMATGLPVIYTPATAMLDLFTGREGYPVEFDLQPHTWEWDRGPDQQPMTVQIQAASARPLSLAQTMLAVYDDPLGAFMRGRLAADRVRKHFTWQACGATLLAIARHLSREPIYAEEGQQATAQEAITGQETAQFPSAGAAAGN